MKCFPKRAHDGVVQPKYEKYADDCVCVSVLCLVIVVCIISEHHQERVRIVGSPESPLLEGRDCGDCVHVISFICIYFIIYLSSKRNIWPHWEISVRRSRVLEPLYDPIYSYRNYLLQLSTSNTEKNDILCRYLDYLQVTRGIGYLYLRLRETIDT